MFTAGSVTSAGDVLAMNFLMDRDAEHRARDFAGLKAGGGRMRHGRPDRADGRARRRLHLALRARSRQRAAPARADADTAHPVAHLHPDLANRALNPRFGARRRGGRGGRYDGHDGRLAPRAHLRGAAAALLLACGTDGGSRAAPRRVQPAAGDDAWTRAGDARAVPKAPRFSPAMPCPKAGDRSRRRTPVTSSATSPPSAMAVRSCSASRSRRPAIAWTFN